MEAMSPLLGVNTVGPWSAVTPEPNTQVGSRQTGNGGRGAADAARTVALAPPFASMRPFRGRRGSGSTSHATPPCAHTPGTCRHHQHGMRSAARQRTSGRGQCPPSWAAPSRRSGMTCPRRRGRRSATAHPIAVRARAFGLAAPGKPLSRSDPMRTPPSSPAPWGRRQARECSPPLHALPCRPADTPCSTDAASGALLAASTSSPEASPACERIPRVPLFGAAFAKPNQDAVLNSINRATTVKVGVRRRDVGWAGGGGVAWRPPAAPATHTLPLPTTPSVGSQVPSTLR